MISCLIQPKKLSSSTEKQELRTQWLVTSHSSFTTLVSDYKLLVECLALWGKRERSCRQYRSQVSVFKPALFTEHSNTDKKKKRRTVVDSVANIGESGDRDRCLGTSVAYLGVNTRP